MDNNIVSQVLEFVDDAKLYSNVNRSNNDNDLLGDLEKREKWSEKWQMLFNFDKCKCLHLGCGSPNLGTAKKQNPRK